jgi:hypothetical protein
MIDIIYGTFGGGVNTIAGLIYATKLGIKFDFIVMADPGKENPGTYEYREYFNKWLVAHGQPEVTVVYQKNFKGEFVGLYQNCLNEGMLPSIVYGYKSCSLKYKAAPQDVFANNNEAIRACWKSGYRVQKFMWYDADESHRAKDYSNNKYLLRYLLVENDIDRFGCVQIIIDEGLRLPSKSSCTFCPSMKPFEIIELYETHYKEFYDAIRMEDNANSNLLSIKGLGRDFSWWELILAYKYFKLIKRYNSMKPIPKRILKMVKKINKSVKNSKSASKNVKQNIKNKNAIEITCDLFKSRIDAPCECMN